MTKEDWAKAEKALDNIYGHVRFIIDGYKVSVGYVRENPTTSRLAVYIDGVFKANWCFEDCEIRRRFCRKIKKQAYTNKERANFIKAVGKKNATKFEKEHSNMLYYEYYEPYFGSFRTLKSHFIKNNQSIELAEVDWL